VTVNNWPAALPTWLHSLYLGGEDAKSHPLLRATFPWWWQRGLPRMGPLCFLRSPLEAVGTRANHVYAFVQTDGEREVVVAVPRLLAYLIGTGRATGPAVWGEDARSCGRRAPAARSFRAHL
jgi:hypothetical protein